MREKQALKFFKKSKKNKLHFSLSQRRYDQSKLKTLDNRNENILYCFNIKGQKRAQNSIFSHKNHSTLELVCIGPNSSERRMKLKV